MFHNSGKSKPLNCIFYWCWPELVTIMTITFYFFRRFIQVSINISFVLYSIRIKFPFLKQWWMVDIFYWGFKIFTEDVDFLLLSIIELFLNIRRMKTCIYRQIIQCVWSGSNCGRTYHAFVWIICIFFMNYLFYLSWKFFQINNNAIKISKSFLEIVCKHPFMTS